MVQAETIGKDAVIEVFDESAGFDPGAIPWEGRCGLAIMEERVETTGGQLGLDSIPGRGPRVTVCLSEAAS